MNKVIEIGRLTRDPECGESNGVKHGRYSLAVDRPKGKDGKDNGADFIPCVVFGKGAEFTEKYLRKGMKIAIEGRIQTGSYTNRDGVKVYTTDVVVEKTEFCESKGDTNTDIPAPATDDGFMNLPDGIDEELPFN